jgi:2-keto-4-pentenoate hydratase/2-oxohepta-3-ene-1,7-dioic acid hydratase in catechol pathway
MRLATFETNAAETVAARLDGEEVRPIPGYADVGMLIAAGAPGLNAARAAVGAEPLVDARPLTPLPAPSKILAIGLNYRDHAEEVGAELPAEPLVFAKLTNSLSGPGATIPWDEEMTRAVDYEAELVVAIGRQARNLAPGDGLDHVFGYACGNDLSARDLQVKDVQWTRGKSFDGFAPVGPWITTADELPDPGALGVRCEVNGERLQDGNTAAMIFGVAELVERISTWCTLQPGDLIFTGTPAGIGAARKPRRFLEDGDRVAVEIDGLGRLENTCAVTARPTERSKDGDR